MDILVGVLGLEKKELGYNQVGEVIVDFSSQENYTVFQKP
jgi:hypothetical protein